MKQLLIRSSLGTILILAVSHSAFGQNYTPKVIPQCRVVDTKTNETVCAYTLEQVKALYKLDVELADLRAAAGLKDQKIAALESIISESKTKDTAYQDIIKHVEDRNADLLQKYLACDKALQYERAKPQTGSFIAWAIAGVGFSLAAGVLIASAVK